MGRQGGYVGVGRGVVRESRGGGGGVGLACGEGVT